VKPSDVASGRASSMEPGPGLWGCGWRRAGRNRRHRACPYGDSFLQYPSNARHGGGSSFTCLSAIVKLGVGVLLLGACVFPMSAKSAIGHFWCAPCGLGNRHRRRHPKTLPHVGLHQGHRLLSISSSVLYGGFRAAALSPIFFPSRREVSRASSATVDSTASMT